MKKIILLISATITILSCDKKPNKIQPTESIESDSITKEEEVVTKNTSTFKIENIPFSNSDIGDFPYFKLPEGLKPLNKPLEKKFDVCYFPINGVMTPFEGKLYKIHVTNVQGEEYSKRYFEKSMEDYLNTIGAVKVFDGVITREEYERYHKQDPNKGDEGDIGYADENIKFYVIRSKEKGNIYVQFSSSNSGGKLNILQEESFKQTITKITSENITKDLTEKGKSILYINFDTDKATLSTEGKEAVMQINNALKLNPDLKIIIEGHTDNMGDAIHNKKLSNDRANAVLNNLISLGINKSRLTAKGFGAERPLVANDSEENKAKNRRVELVKVN